MDLIRIFRNRICPDLDSGKKSNPDPHKRTRIRGEYLDTDRIRIVLYKCVERVRRTPCLGSTASMAARICLSPMEKVLGMGTVAPRMILMIRAGRVGAYRRRLLHFL